LAPRWYLDGIVPAVRPNHGWHIHDFMSESIEFSKAEKLPKCPHCEIVLSSLDTREEKLSLGGFHILILSCPICRKIISILDYN
jgi:hypothetical protein